MTPPAHRCQPAHGPSPATAVPALPLSTNVSLDFVGHDEHLNRCLVAGTFSIGGGSHERPLPGEVSCRCSTERGALFRAESLRSTAPWVSP